MLKEVAEELQESLDCRMRVLISPNFQFQSFHIPGDWWKEKDLIYLAVFSWYLEDYQRCYLNVWLGDIWIQPESRPLMDLVLSSKEYALNWISETVHYRAFKGNVLEHLRIICRTIVPKSDPSTKGKVVRGQRKRGYQDHGTLRPSDRWSPSTDFSLTEEQNRIEAERQSLEDTANFLRGWFE
jgi:hypothetical protein